MFYWCPRFFRFYQCNLRILNQLTKNEDTNLEEMSAQLCVYQRNCKSSDSYKNENEPLVVKSFKNKLMAHSTNNSNNNNSYKRLDICNYCNKKG